MYNVEQRRTAIEIFIKFGHCYADTIAILGYPNRLTLRLDLFSAYSEKRWKASSED